MKKWIFSLSLLFTLSLGHVQEEVKTHSHDDNNVHFFTHGDGDYVHPDSVPTLTLKVVPVQVTGFNAEARAKLDRAFMVLEKVMNSEEFKEKVLNFKNTRGQRAYASNKGMTNEEIYEHIMGGREDLLPNTPGEMNYYLRLYNKPWSKVIGYTTPDVNLININWKFFRNFTPNEVAGNLAHEWLHKMGFGHRSAAEHDSVPYAVGYIVEELSRKYLQKRELH